MTTSAPSEAALEALAYHGGNLAAARRLFPDAPQPWIDLSTGVNPHAYPLPPIPPLAWARLPDVEALARLEAVAAERYGARSPREVVAAAGSQTIIQMLARLNPVRRVGVLGPTYQGHARAWDAAGADVVEVDRLETLADFEVAVVVNPNNPDGGVTPAAALRRLAAALAAREGLLIIDEAFLDFDAADETLARDPPARAVVLRSFGKTFGLAGLRLGFAIVPPELASPLRAALGPWPVSGPALEIGAKALSDTAWLQAMTARLDAEAHRLDELLQDAGWRIVGGTKLFRLAAHVDARAKFLALLRAGILARPFSQAPDRLRFGLPADDAAWERLAAALAD